jgi:dTDP-4-dehydrorhamnose reductase
MRVLVTGANGQLGSELRVATAGNGEFFYTDRDTLDICDTDRVERFCMENGIDMIVNCAAYTAVDRAEEEVEKAFAINADAVRGLATIASRHDLGLVHISTDYVFDGHTYRPYREDDEVSPKSVYGKSKLEGERAIMEIAPARCIVIRTSWVYSEFGTNFVKSMLRLAKERESLSIVADQVGSPTYALDLADAILSILPLLECDEPRIYHYSNEGVCSWYDFAKAIFDLSGIDISVEPIGTHQYPLPAKRPPYSVLDKSAIKSEFGLKIPYWRESLRDSLGRVNGGGR